MIKSAKKSQKMSCCSEKQHPDHQELVPGINRVIGQLEGIKRMIGERRYCPDILVQLRAVRSAINTIEASMLETHLGACVKDAFNSDDEKEIIKKIAELKDLFKRFNG